jgi:SynChlorMet cassette radical SAM/SPASM protein ScmE
MSEQSKLKVDSKVIFREEDDIGLIFNPDTGKINILNSTGKFIWSRLDGEKTKEDIIQEMRQDFDIEDQDKLGEDFDNFIHGLKAWGVLEGVIESRYTLNSVCLGITSQCNLSCKHCLNRNSPAPDPDMTNEELFKVMEELSKLEVKNVSLFGGEPLCHPDFKPIVEYANKCALNLSLNTNGTLIDREMARWLKKHGISGGVVSLDGSRVEVMDKIRGEGAFEKCLKGIQALKSEEMSVLLSVTLNKINYRDVREMVLLGKKINGNSIRFNHVFFSGNAACYLKEIYLSPKEEKEAIEAVWQAKEEFPDFIDPSSSYLAQKKKLGEIKNYPPTDDKISVLSCGAAMNKCAIRPDGWVVPCEIIWEVRCGNLRNNSLRDIWENSEVMNSFRKPLEVDLSEISECRGCEYQYLCFQGHRCYPYYYPGGIQNRSLYCWLAK